MARFALVKDGKFLNTIAVDPESGFVHPDGDMIPIEDLMPDALTRKGIVVAENDEDVLKGFQEGKIVSVGPIDSRSVYGFLVTDELVPGIIISSSGTTGTAKGTITPWDVFVRRSEAWLSLIGEIQGPVWHVHNWRSSLGWASARFSFLRKGIECYYGFDNRPETYNLVVGDPGVLSKAVRRGLLTDKAPVICMGRIMEEQELSILLSSGRVVYDHYGASETGILAMTKHVIQNGVVVSKTALADGVSIGPRGTVIVKNDRLALKYADQPLRVTDGVFDTGDLAEITPEGELTIKGRLG
jgi:acyl-coenzyme A synthetase/AMP-(fatty) acid ligase